MNPAMIFFDLDGTLIDSNGVWLQVDHDFLGRRGLQVTEEYSYVVGHSIFPVAAQFTKDYYGLPDTPSPSWTSGRPWPGRPTQKPSH